MRYFLDCEFIERGYQHPIDLISIGIVAEDGREYYALNYDCDWNNASQWVKDNVLNQLPEKPLPCLYRTLEEFKNSVAGRQGWRNRDTIADEIKEFCNPEKYGEPEIWGYYADYDHIVLCQLFGTMIELPKGFPMYTKDLKQTIDELGHPFFKKQSDGQHNALSDAKWIKDTFLYLQGTYKHPAFEHEIY